MSHDKFPPSALNDRFFELLGERTVLADLIRRLDNLVLECEDQGEDYNVRILAPLRDDLYAAYTAAETRSARESEPHNILSEDVLRKTIFDSLVSKLRENN